MDIFLQLKYTILDNTRLHFILYKSNNKMRKRNKLVDRIEFLVIKLAKLE